MQGWAGIKKYSENSTQNLTWEDSTGGPVAKTPYFQHKGPKDQPWSEDKIQHAAVRLKIPCTASKTQCSQIDKLNK